MIKSAICRLLPFALLLIAGCTPNPLIHDGSEAAIDRSTRKTQADGHALRTSDIDFSRIFEEDPAPRETGFIIEPVTPVHSMRHPSFRVRKRPIRVMLRRDLREIAVSSGGTVQIRAAGANMTFNGRANFEAGAGSGAVIVSANNARREMRLPCTLFVSGGGRGRAGQITIGENTYRGALIFASEGGNNFSIINLIAVEDYIRGVVPLEIGNLREPDIEALKVQAIAARTYAYKRMAANERRLFDVVATVADQVYGGANAEGEVPDRAILLTQDLIMVYDNQIVGAFYHSTCGGKTANIEDVWGGGPFPYLRSIDDVDASGKAFCAGSNTFAWTETWSDSQLAGILRRYSSEGNLQPPFSGSLRGMEVRERFECGRVKTLAITSSGNREHTTGGDRTRFLIRRPTRAQPILRSSNIGDITFAGGQVTITGNGHGHGIGMCQVGAIARARAGHNFDQILQAYYSGVAIRTVIDDR
ncbi:MAG: SpoIID/LytB domain-containing protein [Chitinispirillales bacterium]|jgi:stage II sporulation protein D|nr:SpoIID/LytB domain-containing protein [Chitinispirillales bacterium]